jgi:hypothetical protein
MPQLIKKVSGSVLDNFIGEVIIFNPIVGLIQREDYINLPNFTAFLQNLIDVDVTVGLTKPLSFGLKQNKTSITLNISY